MDNPKKRKQWTKQDLDRIEKNKGEVVKVLLENRGKPEAEIDRLLREKLRSFVKSRAN